MKKRTVCVLGLGYIGLPTGAVLANRGYSVRGVDIREDVVATINGGGVHIQEPGLDAFVRSAVASGQLKAHLRPEPSDVFIIAVPTPFKPGFVPDVDYVIAATQSIAPHVRPGNLVILESTSPVGTTQLIADTLQESGIDVSKVHFAFCPERVLPGRILKEFLENDRVVGGLTPAATEVAMEFYREFIEGQVHGTDARTAEMVKLTENSFRDVNIAFANELSMICAKSGIDVNELISLANRHPRVKILQPGCGVGGHCIAVDPWFIVNSHPDDAVLIRTSRERNLKKTEWVLDEIRAACARVEKKKGRKPVVACFGLAFKPDVDDLRESPALEIAHRLIEEKFSVIGVEPNVEHVDGIPLRTADEAMKQADVVALLMAHTPFRKLSFNGLETLDFCGATARKD